MSLDMTEGLAMSKEILKEVSLRITDFTGWQKVDVVLNDDVLHVECEQQLLLRYNLRTGQEIYGRVRHVGFRAEDLVDLKLRLLKDTKA